MLVEVVRRVMWRRRVRAAHRWRDAEREAYAAAKRRILDLAAVTPDPSRGRR
jgi:hypothetical protein